MRAIVAFLTAAACLAPAQAAAQETRAAVLERERAQKAGEVKPYEPGRLEKFVLRAEEGQIQRLIAPHNGFFGEYGYTSKPVGSGIAFGGGFRHDLFERKARLELEAGASFRSYQMFRAGFSLPRLVGEHLELGVEGTYKRQPQDDFYGLGPGSLKDDRVSFFYKGTEVQGRAVVGPQSWVRIGSRFGTLSPSIRAGEDPRFPSIEATFDDASAPGLLAQPDYSYADVFAEVDTRDEPGNARAGGHYLVSWRKYWDRDLDRYSFNSLDLLFQQFVPIFDKKRVFAFQAGFVANNAADGQQVPFYMRPTVGGSHRLRSFADYRFRDTHAMWLNAEYRWEAFGLLDMALFTDLGKVAPEASELDFSDLKRAYGIGFRFNTSRTVFLRVDVATGGGEGVRYFFKFNKAF